MDKYGELAETLVKYGAYSYYDLLCEQEEDLHVVGIGGYRTDGKWLNVAQFYFTDPGDAFRFFDSDVDDFIKKNYTHLDIEEFDVAIWDGTFDNGEPLERITVTI